MDDIHEGKLLGNGGVQVKGIAVSGSGSNQQGIFRYYPVVLYRRIFKTRGHIGIIAFNVVIPGSEPEAHTHPRQIPVYRVPACIRAVSGRLSGGILVTDYIVVEILVAEGQVNAVREQVQPVGDGKPGYIFPYGRVSE